MNARFWRVAPPTDRELCKFGLIMAAAALVFAALAWHKESSNTAAWLLAAAACLSLGALTWKKSLGPLYKVWMVIGGFLGFVNSHILLALTFYGLFAPIGLFLRLLRRDLLDRRFDSRSNSRDSHWIRRERPLLPRDHYERQF